MQSALEHYLGKLENNTQTIYHVEEIYNTKLLPQITSKKQDAEEIANQIRNLVFSTKPLMISLNNRIYSLVSDQSWYIEHEKEYKIAGISTLSLDPNLCKTIFENELKNSEIIRKEKLEYVREALIPFLGSLSEDLVSGCILRGDLVDKNKFPTPNSNIDLIILTNFQHYDKVRADQLLSQLRGVPCDSELDYYAIGPKGYTTEGVPFTNKGSKHKVEFSVISLPGFNELCISMRKIGQTLTKYVAENFPHAIILQQKQDAARQFLDKTLKFSPKLS